MAIKETSVKMPFNHTYEPIILIGPLDPIIFIGIFDPIILIGHLPFSVVIIISLVNLNV